MKHAVFLVLMLTLVSELPVLEANVLPRPLRLRRINRKIQGQVLDFTNNHGRDNRIFSPAMGEKRDMYVYLPAGYDPKKCYPLGIYLHGFISDEEHFLEDVVIPFDQAMREGRLPPMILACPDGSPYGIDCLTTTGTFYVNSLLGNFEDYLVQDVYNFLMKNFPIRPEPEAHALLGVSMGGGAAFNKVIKHRDKFGVAATFAPPVNLRWISCRGEYFDNFDPNCWCYREDFSRGRDVVGIFFRGLVKIRLRSFIFPIYGKGNPDMAALIARENPIELLDTRNVGPGFAEFYIAYGGKDQFNLDAQVESFLYRARQKGVEVTVDYDPEGTHSEETALKMLPAMLEWLRVRIEPYSPK